MASWITDDKPSSGSATGLVADAINDGTTTVAPSQNAVFDALALKADLASPALTGDPTAPTQAQGNNSTRLATTAYVQTEAGLIFEGFFEAVAGLVPKSTVTTKGDLIVGTGAGAITRRAVGSNGQVLTADSSETDGVRWSSVTPVWTLVEERTLGANSALETFSSLTGYTQFRLTVEGRSTATGATIDGLLVRFNADAGSNYAFSRQGWYDTTQDTFTGGSSQSSIAAGFLAGSQTNTNRRGMVTAQIMQKTGGFAVLKSEYVCQLSNGSSAYGGHAAGTWSSATAISSLSVFLASGSLALGAVIRLEGRA